MPSKVSFSNFVESGALSKLEKTHSVSLLSEEKFRETIKSKQSKIAVLSHDFYIIDGTLSENITFGTKYYDQDSKKHRQSF